MKTLTLATAIILIAVKTSLNAQPNKPQWVNMSPFPKDYNGSIYGFFLSADEGWITQSSKYKAHTLYYTNDGAKNFTPIYTLNDSANSFKWIQMFDSKRGYCATGYSNIYGFLKTRDGGHNWQNVNIDTAFLNQFTFSLQGKYYFTDSLTGFTDRYIENEGVAIFKTTDGAETWQKTSIVGVEDAGLMPIEVGNVTNFFLWMICMVGLPAIMPLMLAFV